MKAIGIVRRLDDLGRLVIPKEIRKNFNIEKNANMEIFIEGDKIILKKYISKSLCDKCGSEIDYNDVYCRKCGEKNCGKT